LKGFTIAQVTDVQVCQDFINAGEDLFSGQSQVLHSKGNFRNHLAGHNLSFRVLQQRSDLLG
jgi:hypothetical protein